MILMSFDSARLALSNEILFDQFTLCLFFEIFPKCQISEFRVRDSTFPKSEFRFAISIFFYPRKILFLIFKIFFRRDPNSPGLPGIQSKPSIKTSPPTLLLFPWQSQDSHNSFNKRNFTTTFNLYKQILGIAVIHGEQKVDEESGREDGRQSPPTASLGVSYEFLPPNVPKDKPPLTVVGDVSNKIAIIVDDIIDDAHSFVAVAEVLKARGAKKIYVVATHGLLSLDAPSLLEASPIDEIIVTNTVPHEIQKQRCHKIKTVDISLLLCEAIRRIYNNESMAPLFKDLTIDD
ncbi:unnamed protein product [Meloidogyne enterolobii]|uniref:Uncharacterized protein n=1 Tax=Meloidogyne enterolobii TaxID=390850 RepID=A0ACB0YGY6_MELEN